MTTGEKESVTKYLQPTLSHKPAFGVRPIGCFQVVPIPTVDMDAAGRSLEVVIGHGYSLVFAVGQRQARR